PSSGTSVQNTHHEKCGRTNFTATKLALENALSICVSSMSLKNGFGNIKANYASFHTGGLLLMVSEPPSWHIDAAGRPSTTSRE
ncbi:MAG: hypothetical protein ABF452_14895, partial [Gluconobacter potus]